MGKKLITEKHVAQLFQEGKREILVGKDDLLAPLAKDFASSKQMKIIFGKKEEPLPPADEAEKNDSSFDAEIRKIIRRDFAITDENDLEVLVQKVKSKTSNQ